MSKQTEEARAIAEGTPVIDVTEAVTETTGPGTAVEAVTAPSTTTVTHGEVERSAIEAAAEAALNLPGVPGRDEFLSLAMQARILSLSAAAPEAVRNNPHLAFHVAMIGRDLGISPSAALEQIDVISGKKGPQLSLSPQLLAGQVRRLGLGSIRPISRSAEACIAGAYGPDGTLLGESEFTWEDAQMAGLAGPDCRPTEHSNACKAWTKGQTCNQGYKSYPKRMMWWRAAGFAVDDFFPEAGLGLYSPEELGAVVDDTGRPIDPTTVELPSGYEKQATAAEREAERQAEAARVATDDEKAALSEKIEAMPPPAVQALAAAWSAPTEEKYEDGTPVPFLLPRRLLPIGQLKKANALVDSILARAKRGEWGEWVGQTATTSPDSPQDAPETASGPEEAPTPPEDDEDELCECGALATFFTDDGLPVCDKHTPEDQA